MADFPILVMSTDSFADCWNPYFHLFKKYYPEFNNNLYLFTESSNYSHEGLDIINLNYRNAKKRKKPTWTQCFLDAMSQIKEEIFLLWLDDLFLSSNVKGSVIDAFHRCMIDHTIPYIGLGGNSGPFHISGISENLTLIDSKTSFRISLLPSLWNKSLMKKYLREHENPWFLEIFGSKRSWYHHEQFYSSNYELFGENTIVPYFPKRTGIIRGKWHPEVPAFFSQEGISIDFTVRGIFSNKKSNSFVKKYLNFDLLFDLLRSKISVAIVKYT
jgi:hypothetical protein